MGRRLPCTSEENGGPRNCLGLNGELWVGFLPLIDLTHQVWQALAAVPGSSAGWQLKMPWGHHGELMGIQETQGLGLITNWA